MKPAVLLSVFCGVAMAFAGAAGAVPPVHQTSVFDYSGSAPCGTFDDVYFGHLDVTVITTYDEGGNVVRGILHFSGWETNYRSDMPSVSVTAHRSYTEIINIATSSNQTVGNVFTLTLPGRGVLFHDVGVLRFENGILTVHGPHDVYYQGYAAFCDALVAATP